MCDRAPARPAGLEAVGAAGHGFGLPELVWWNRNSLHLGRPFRLLGQARGSPVMLAHHRTRATTAEGPVRAPGGSLFRSSEGRPRRVTMLWHRRRYASYPEDRKNDPKFGDFLCHHTRG